MGEIKLNNVDMNKESNVVELKVNSVYKDLIVYFKELATFSEKTKLAYERDIKDFFEVFLKKDIQHLTEKDLSIDKNVLLSFRQSLIDSGKYANSTINRKIRALKSLYDTLSSNGYDINLNIFKKIRELPKKTKSYGVLTPEEAFLMAELALTTEREHKKLKYYLILVAIKTSLRISDLLALKWSDFKIEDDLVFIDIYEEKTEKEARKPLTRAFYEELLSIKHENQEKVFNVNDGTINSMMKRLREKMNINPNRNIVFHSLRKVGINFVMDVTGDIKAAAEQGNHSNINTTYNSYIDRTKNYDNMAGVLMDRKLDGSVLENLDKDELLELINKLSFSSKIELYKLAKENKGDLTI